MKIFNFLKNKKEKAALLGELQQLQKKLREEQLKSLQIQAEQLDLHIETLEQFDRRNTYLEKELMSNRFEIKKIEFDIENIELKLKRLS